MAKQMRHVGEVDSELVKQALQCVGLKLKIHLDGEKYCMLNTKVEVTCYARKDKFNGLIFMHLPHVIRPEYLGHLIACVLYDKHCTHFIIVNKDCPLGKYIQNPFPSMSCDEERKIYIDTHIRIS